MCLHVLSLVTKPSAVAYDQGEMVPVRASRPQARAGIGERIKHVTSGLRGCEIFDRVVRLGVARMLFVRFRVRYVL